MNILFITKCVMFIKADGPYRKVPRHLVNTMNRRPILMKIVEVRIIR